ncbi:MAG: N-acetylmuramoyl-L-alanine amidase [Clostridium sp.]
MKIYIDQCHGCGQDRGANKYANEEICSDEMTAMAVTKLRSLGHEVLATRPTGNLTVQQSLSWRCSRANNWGADVFISNHNNAGGGKGAEVYTYNGSKLVEAQRYLQYILNHGGKTHDGTNTHQGVDGAIKNGNDLAVINGTTMKALLLENFFVDTKSDVDFYNANKEMFANALVYGITGVDVEINEPNEEKEEMVKCIIQYENEVDMGAANILADAIRCCTINSKRPYAEYNKFEIVIAVGSGTKFSGYTQYLISPSDRYLTTKVCSELGSRIYNGEDILKVLEPYKIKN